MIDYFLHQSILAQIQLLGRFAVLVTFSTYFLPLLEKTGHAYTSLYMAQYAHFPFLRSKRIGHGPPRFGQEECCLPITP